MTYDFECMNEDCKETFTIERSMNETSEVLCVKCGSKVKRIYKPVGMVWKCGGAFGKSK